MLALIVICIAVEQLSAATTVAPSTHAHHSHHAHHTHPTREPAELETFKYDPHTHMMAVLNHKTCYLYSMTAQETTDVHTLTGLHSLEAKLVTMIDDTTATYSTMTQDEVMALSKLLAKSCNHHGWTTYKLN